MSSAKPLPADDADLVRSLGVPTNGTVYDLSSGWWRHMPTFDGYPRFEVVTYNSPQGQRVERRFPFSEDAANDVGFGYVSELVSGSLHTGTHIDALCHVTCGSEDEWHGSASATAELGNYGATRGDASELAPIIGRGVLLDVPGVLGLEVLPPHFAIGEEHLRRAAEAAGITIAASDIVLVRTGQMKFWPDIAKITESGGGSGVALDGARWLLSHGVRYVGADTMSFEVRPSEVEGNPLPVHLLLLQQHGVHIMEWVDCEELAADGVAEFLFIGLPLTIRGGTGSPLRPIAVV
ncbi:cyclase family protein [Saccharopolyspora sp. WRP15-2]|uniref:Cyclase family protein n=1 Tax=Saccharopolyspora oryzae TaxID=2997343 RepID=A0ABT4USC3_9PSEU|nr:cyclase family protein [Saccharopolyspora oryzae]MDA3624009.1 cyclase family protein [Saccharopolyspora oryzae]